MPDKAALTVNSFTVIWQVDYKQNDRLNFLNISLQSQDCKVCPYCLRSYAIFPNTWEDINELLKETKGKGIWFLLPWLTMLIGYLCAAYWPWHCALLSVLGYSPVCPPCDNEMKTDAILEHMCASEFGKCSETLLCLTHTNTFRGEIWDATFKTAKNFTFLLDAELKHFQCSTCYQILFLLVSGKWMYFIHHLLNEHHHLLSFNTQNWETRL